MGIRGEGGMEVGERNIIHLLLHCHHQNDSCIKVGSDESHFNVSLTVRDKVTRQCPQTTTFEEKGKPKRYQTEVLPLTSLTPYRQAKPAHEVSQFYHGPIYRVDGSTSHFSQFNCCLNVVLQLDKGDYPENSHVVFCPNKQRSFEPLTCFLDLR